MIYTERYVLFYAWSLTSHKIYSYIFLCDVNVRGLKYLEITSPVFPNFSSRYSRNPALLHLEKYCHFEILLGSSLSTLHCRIWMEFPGFEIKVLCNSGYSIPYLKNSERKHHKVYAYLYLYILIHSWVLTKLMNF